ncbi:MAG: thiamine pyrophosphate-dependent dehydrogenase E1 component subunit alpha, partial [Gaiellales bacterium]
GHGHAIAKGLDLSRLMAELYGKRTGICRGRGGSMHFADVALGALGGNGIVAGGLPMATGSALAHRRSGTDGVVVAFLGEGGVNQGTFHESLNLAGLWALPIVYVIENNLYTEYIHYRNITAIDPLSDRAASYGFPGLTVDGQDVVSVHQAARDAISRARSGEGPTLLEMRTFRFRGHHEGEEQILGVNVYRSVDDIEREKRERDPLDLARDRLVRAGVPAEALADLEAEVETILEGAVEFAETSDLPDASEAMQDVYTAPPSEPR